MTTTEGSAAEVLTVDDRLDPATPSAQQEALEALETGGVVFLPTGGFPLLARERELLADVRNILLNQADNTNGRPTVIFEPEKGKIKRLNYAYAGWLPARAKLTPSVVPDLEAMMVRFGRWADELIARLLPRYAGRLGRDRVTYRPNQRDAVQPLHVDAAYGYPTQGRGMLRIFCNIDPLARPRIWQIGEPFESFARRFLPGVRLREPGGAAALLARLGLVGGKRTAYDTMIAELRHLGKRDQDYQRTAPRRVIAFPSGSAWLAITDLVLHGAMSGQHSLDQTFFLPPSAMHDPARSSLRILERLSGRRLV